MMQSRYQSQAMLNGRLFATEALRVSPLGDGFMFGHGLFETIKVQGGKPVFFEDHHARLARSSTELGLGLVPPTDALRERCDQVIAANQLTNGSLKLVIFQDESAVGELILTRDGLYPAESYTRGFRLRTVGGQARAGAQFAHKTLNYLHNITAKREAVAAGFDEALFVDENENLLEGAASSIFVVKEGRVLTPPTDGRILPGVARRRVILSLGDRVREASVSLNELNEADEVFVTNALLGVMPVAQVDGQSYDLARNPVTREAMVMLKGLSFNR